MRKFVFVLLLVLFVDIDFAFLVYGGRVASIIALIVLMAFIAAVIGYCFAKA